MNSTQNETIPYLPERTDPLLEVKNVLFSIIFALSILGNGLLMISILCFHKLRRLESNYLVFNLALCDILSTIFIIPFNMAIYNNPSSSYPFGLVGCKLILPLATYTVTVSVFTLVCISIERFVAISSIQFRFTKKLLIVTIFVIHVLGLALVVPYCLTLTYISYEGTAYCYEKWEHPKQQKIYTIVLFVIQYGLPLPLMIFFYSASWRKIMLRNRKMIRISEEYERKIAFEDHLANRDQNENQSFNQYEDSSISSNHNNNNCKGNISNMNNINDRNVSIKTGSIHSSMSVGSEAKEEESIISSRAPPKYEEAIGLLNGGDSEECHVEPQKEGDDENVTNEVLSIESNNLKMEGVHRNPETVNTTNKSRSYTSESQNEFYITEEEITTPAATIKTTKHHQYNHRNRAHSLRATFNVVPVKTRRVIRKIKLIRKPKYISQMAYMRHRQTIRTLKIFTTIVVVFAVFALPNQLLWLLFEFCPDFTPQLLVIPVFTFLSFLNAMSNCWVYFFYNSSFRKAYKIIFLKLLPCLQRYYKMPRLFTNNNSTKFTQNTHVTDETFSTDGRCFSGIVTSDPSSSAEVEVDLESRQKAFNDMFEDHINNFERYKHLYNPQQSEINENIDEQSENVNLLSPQITPRKERKLSDVIGNFFNFRRSISTPSSPQQRKISSLFTTRNSQLAGLLFPVAQRMTTEQRSMAHTQPLRPKSMLDHIDINNLVLRESVEKKPKRASSATDVRSSTQKQPPGQHNRNSKTAPNTPVQRKRSLLAFFSPKFAKINDLTPPQQLQVSDSQTTQTICNYQMETTTTVNNNENIAEEMVTALPRVTVQIATTSKSIKLATASSEKDLRKKRKMSIQTTTPPVLSPRIQIDSIIEDDNNSQEIVDNHMIADKQKNCQQLHPTTASIKQQNDTQNEISKPSCNNYQTSQQIISLTKQGPKVPPKPNFRIEKRTKKKQKTNKDNEGKNNDNDNNSRDRTSLLYVGRHISPLARRKERLVQAVQQQEQRPSSSLERRESVKKLQDKNLVKTLERSVIQQEELRPTSSLERRNSVIKLEEKNLVKTRSDSFETNRKRRSRGGSTSSESEHHDTWNSNRNNASSNNLSINNNYVTNNENYNKEENDIIDTSNNENLKNTKSYEGLLNQEENTFSDIVNKLDNSTEKNINELDVTNSETSQTFNRENYKKKRKISRRPDISTLIKHTSSLPSLMNKIEDLKLTLPPSTLHNANDTTKAEQTTGRVAMQYNLSPRTNSFICE